MSRLQRKQLTIITILNIALSLEIIISDLPYGFLEQATVAHLFLRIWNQPIFSNYIFEVAVRWVRSISHQTASNEKSCGSFSPASQSAMLLPLSLKFGVDLSGSIILSWTATKSSPADSHTQKTVATKSRESNVSSLLNSFARIQCKRWNYFVTSSSVDSRCHVYSSTNGKYQIHGKTTRDCEHLSQAVGRKLYVSVWARTAHTNSFTIHIRFGGVSSTTKRANIILQVNFGTSTI